MNRCNLTFRNHGIAIAMAIAMAMAFCLAASVVELAAMAQEEVSVNKRSEAFDAAIKAAMVSASDGWSVDEVLLDDQRRKGFLQACRREAELQSEAISEKAILERLVQIRKAGKLDIKASKRANSDMEEWIPIAEMASRLLEDRFHANIDQWLVDPKLLSEFDAIAAQIAPGTDRYACRKAAMQLRKSRRLQPELLMRVTDWKREIRSMTVEFASLHLADLPPNAGVYIFRDRTGFLYIGQSNSLRTRLTKHLDNSDRKSLSKYLESQTPDQITIELHVFAVDSPAANTVVREAYESDLIRTRKPRFNLAP